MTVVMPEVDSEVDIQEFVTPYEDSDDPETKTHLVRPIENQHICNGMNMTAKDIVETARMLGLEVVALCGYKWVPLHNPESYPSCQPCFEIAALITAGRLP